MELRILVFASFVVSAVTIPVTVPIPLAIPPNQYNVECGVSDYESRVSTTGSCYRVSTETATWDEANASCEKEGAHLVILNSPDELEVVYNMLQDKPHDSETQYFAGVRADTTTEPRVFKTVLNQTLEEVGYGPWEEDEPNDNEGGKNCVALDTRRRGKYNDVWCHVRMPYVCESSGYSVSAAPLEIRAYPSTPNSVSDPVSLPLPSIKHYRSDYEYNENTDAFYKLHTEGASKTEASRKCIGEGAELVNISSDEDLKQVHAMMKKLTDVEDFVMVASEENSEYDSQNGMESKVVTRWGKIDSTSGHDGLPTVCGIVNETLTCNLNLPFVCKVPAIDAPYTEECNVNSNDYILRAEYPGSCYKVSTFEATWDEAHASCQAEGAHLVILNSVQESLLVSHMLQGKPHDSETQYFVGVRADTATEPRVFKTILNQTLEQVGYGPWEEGEPDDDHNGENCVALDWRRRGKYNDVRCHIPMRFVCESTAPAPPEIPVPSSTPSSIMKKVTPVVVSKPLPSMQYRPGYEYNQNTDAFYKLHTDGTGRRSAEKKCFAEGAELVKITSDEDLKQVQSLMKKYLDLDARVMVASGVYEGSGTEIDAKCNVVDSNGEIDTEIDFNNRPFVCKVAARDAPAYDVECGVYSNDYESKMSTTGSCYRVSRDIATWDEANASCENEGAHLVILNSAEELEVLYNMLQDKPHGPETQYFAGVRADTTTEPRVFKTVLNQSLEEVGYGPWEEDEPNDWYSDKNCVALDTRRHGKYNHVWCHVYMVYVCESSGAPLENIPPGTSSSDITQVSDPVSSPLPSKQYRSDYEYNHVTDAFYKLHIEGSYKNFASKICVAEGAKLAQITSDEDLKQIEAMRKKFPGLNKHVTIALGVYKGKGTRNEDLINVINLEGEIKTTEKDYWQPFVCKVAARDAPVDEECGVFSKDYESKISTTGSCYRVSTDIAEWDQAHATCQAEGAHLVILNSAEELEVLYNMLQGKPNYSEKQYYAGVMSRTDPRVFKTVLNQTLEEVGYEPWEEGEPDDRWAEQYCVALDTRRHGKYNDVSCDIYMPYVCESFGHPLENIPTVTSSSDINQVSDPVSSPLPSKQYRSDYEYNHITDAFYKLHIERQYKMYASDICITEGAELAQITSDEDLKQIEEMRKKFAGLDNPATNELGVTVHKTKDSQSEDLINGRGEIQATDIDRLRPFVCKVAARDAPFDEECGVFSKDYVSKISTTGSCYRVSTDTATWYQAQALCQAEGAHLVILNNAEELEVVYNMLPEPYYSGWVTFFAGVMADARTEPRVFKTVLNQSLEEVGYGPWKRNELKDWGDNDRCVALGTRSLGKYIDSPCDIYMPYICESSGAPDTASSDLNQVSDPVLSPLPCKHYRTDYEYNENTDAFYKLHTEGARNWKASEKCDEEGAELVDLTSDEDSKQVLAMMKQLSYSEKVVMGALVENSNDYFNVINREGEVEATEALQELPYVCKVAASDVPYNEECDVFSKVSDPVSSPLPSKQYRSDYEYNHVTDAFYKLHRDGALNWKAAIKCNEEGAELVELTSDEDSKQVLAMMKKLLYLDNYVMGALVGNADHYYNVINRKGKVQATRLKLELPYVCKVAASKAPYNEECGVFSNDYESRISTTGSCYKISTVEATWYEAHAICQAEGAHLVILSDAEELEMLYNMLQDKPHGYDTQYLVGVKADNQTLEEVGYGPKDIERVEKCVALELRRHGKYNDVRCFDSMPYVCESSGVQPETQSSPSTPNSGTEQMVSAVSSPFTTKQYRPDYEYNKRTDAFYKLHTERERKSTASSKCIEEGAKLAVITSSEDLKQLHAMMKKFPDLQGFVTVDSDSLHHESVEDEDPMVKLNYDYGSPTATGNYEYECTLVNRMGEIERRYSFGCVYYNRPFLCKVAARDAPYNEECGVYSNGYESRISTTGSCYRVSTVEVTWNEAYANCQGEGAHLVILNTNGELEILYNLLTNKAHHSQTQYFAGVRASTNTKPRVFKTVLNQTLEEVGYGPWEEGEPNDWLNNDENCVALDVRRHAKYNDVNCYSRMKYVCESP